VANKPTAAQIGREMAKAVLWYLVLAYVVLPVGALVCIVWLMSR